MYILSNICFPPRNKGYDYCKYYKPVANADGSCDFNNLTE